MSDQRADPGRIRQWLRRVRAMPNHVENTMVTLADQQDALARHLMLLEERLDRLDAAQWEQATMTREAVAADARNSAVHQLIRELGPVPSRRPGLSVLTITWNHAAYLTEALVSAAEALDVRPVDQQGELLVLDDCSSDASAAALAALGESDVRLRYLRAPVNLGLARARNVLLHACQTRHALVLDADNLAMPHGVSALYDVARATEATFTYGNVLLFDQHGSQRVMSNEPILPVFQRVNYIDSLAVIDVDRVASLGGYTLDPLLYALDDYELLHRLVEAGDLLAFVPTVAGRYRILAGSHSRASRDPRPASQRLVRTHRVASQAASSQARVVAAHPRLGELWRSPTAATSHPGRSTAHPDAEAPRRILVVASGGVANLGDEAMTVATIQRLARVRPDWRVDIVADSDEFVAPSSEFTLVGTLRRVCAGVSGDEIKAGCPDNTVAQHLSVFQPDAQPAVLDPRDYHAALFAGGGNLNHHWFDTLTCWRAVLVAGLRAYGLPVIFSGQGIGPIDEERERAVIQFLVAASSSFSLRDSMSLRVLRDLAVDVEAVEVVGDDAVGLELPADEVVHAALADASVGEDCRYLVAHARRAAYVGTDEVGLRAWADAVDRLAVERGVAVVAVAINHQRPHPEAETLAHLAGAERREAEWHVLDCRASPGLAAAIVGRADSAVVHSYHEALFALQAGVPALLVAGTPYSQLKATGLARTAGLSDDFVVRPEEGFANLSNRLNAVARALAVSNRFTGAAERVDAWLDRALKTAVSEPIPA